MRFLELPGHTVVTACESKSRSLEHGRNRLVVVRARAYDPMVGYQVFIERARESSEEGLGEFARTLEARFRTPSDRLVAALRDGRVLVKSNLDKAAAFRFAAELEAMGAICSVIDDDTQAVVQDAPSLTDSLAATEPGVAVVDENLRSSSGVFQLATLDGASADMAAFGDLAEPQSDPAAGDRFAPLAADEEPEIELELPSDRPKPR